MSQPAAHAVGSGPASASDARHGAGSDGPKACVQGESILSALSTRWSSRHACLAFAEACISWLRTNSGNGGHWWCGDGMAHGDADGAVALMARRLLSELMRVVALGLATGDDKAEAAVLKAWDEAAGKLRLCQDCVVAYHIERATVKAAVQAVERPATLRRRSSTSSHGSNASAKSASGSIPASPLTERSAHPSTPHASPHSVPPSRGGTGASGAGAGKAAGISDGHMDDGSAAAAAVPFQHMSPVQRLLHLDVRRVCEVFADVTRWCNAAAQRASVPGGARADAATDFNDNGAAIATAATTTQHTATSQSRQPLLPSSLAVAFQCCAFEVFNVTALLKDARVVLALRQAVDCFFVSRLDGASVVQQASDSHHRRRAFLARIASEWRGLYLLLFSDDASTRTWALGVIRVVAKHQRQAAGRVSHSRHFISEQDFKDQVYPVLLTVTRYLQQRTDAAGSVARAPAVPARSRSPTAHARAHKRRRRNSADGVSTTRSPGATGSPHSRHEPPTVWTWKHAAAQLTMNQLRQQQQGPPVSVTKPSLHAFWCGLRMIVQTAESPACAALLQSPTVGDRIVSAMLAGMRYCAAPVRAHSAPLGSHDGAQSMSSAASRPRTARPGMGRLRSFSVGGVAELSGVRKRSQLLLGSDGGNGSGGDRGGDSGGSAAATTQRGRRNRLHSVDVTHGDRHTVHRDVRAQLRETLSLAPMLAVLSELSARTEVAELLRTATEPPLSNFAPQVVGVLKQLEAQLATSHTASTSIGHCVALVAQCRRQLGAAAQKGRRRVRSIVSHLPAPLPRLPQPSCTPVRSNPSLRDALLKGASLKGASGVGAPAAVSSHCPAPVVPVQPAAEGGGTPAPVATSVAAVAPTLGTVSSNAGASKDGQDGAAAGAGAGDSATTSVSTAISEAVTAQGGKTSRGVAPAAPVDSGAVDVASGAPSSPAVGRHLDLSQASANTSASHGRESEIDLCGDTGSDEDMTPAAVATTPDADNTDAPVTIAQPTPSTGGGHHSPAARDASVVIVVSSDESDGEQLLRKRQRLKRRRRCVVSSGSDSDSDADSSVHATTLRTRTKGDSGNRGDDGGDSDGVVVQETSGGSGSSGSDAGGSDDTGSNEDSEQASSSDSDEAMPPEVQRAVQAAKRRKAKRDAAAALPARTTAASITSSAASKVRLAALANLQRRPTAKTTDAPASTRVSLVPNPARGQPSDNDAGGTRVRPVKKARLRGPGSSTKADAVPFFMMSSSGRAPAPTGKPFTVLKSKPRAQGVSAGAFGSAKSGIVSASKSSAGAGAGAASMFTSTPHGVVVSKRSGRMAGAKAGGGITVDMSGFFQRVLAMTVDWVVSPHYALVQLAQDGTPVAGTSLAGDVKAAAAVEAVASVPSDSLALVAVPAVFRSAVQYTSVFKRLLYEEVRAMLYQGLQWAARCGRLAATRQGSSGAANILAPRSRTTVASLLRPDALQRAPAETTDGPLRVAVTATARGTGALQLLTKGTESDDSFFTLVFEVVTPVAPGKGAGARQAIEQGMLSTHASMGGFSHHDVVLLQPVVTEKMAKSAGSSAAATVFGVVAGTGDKDDAPGNRRPRSNGAALVRIKVLRRRVTGAVAVAMRTHSRWHCLALDNLTTCMREYQGINVLPFTSVAAELLKPPVAKPESGPAAVASPIAGAAGSSRRHHTAGVSIPPALAAKLTELFNASQIAAIHAVIRAARLMRKAKLRSVARTSAASRDRQTASRTSNAGGGKVVCVQGPPGTGKTMALCGMLSGLFSVLPSSIVTPVSGAAAAASTARAAGRFPVHRRSTTATSSRSSGALKSRILVASPSNAAVDEVVKRLVKHGLLARNGSVFHPVVVRVGPGCRARRAKARSLDVLVDQRMAALGHGDATRRRDHDSSSTAPGAGKPPGKQASELSAHQARVTELSDAVSRARTQLSAAELTLRHCSDSSTNKDRRDAKLLKTRATLELTRLTTRLSAAKALLAKAQAQQQRSAGSNNRHNRGRGKSDNGSSAGLSTRELRNLRDSLKREILGGANVVATTLSSALSHEMLDSGLQFSVVVVDEAAQATEPSTVLPLRFRAQLMIVVGDDQQLPATVMSPLAEGLGYRRSLLQRLREGGCTVHMLQQQYRMHPDLAAFPSAHFYGGALQNAPVVTSQARLAEAAAFRGHTPCFTPFLFYDVPHGSEARGGGGGGGGHKTPSASTSLRNDAEAQLVAAMVLHLRDVVTSHVAKHGNDRQLSVGVITPYRDQVTMVQRLLTSAGIQVSGGWGGHTAKATGGMKVEVSTVDGFQGREMDVVIITCVRAPSSGSGSGGSGGGGGGIGFLSDHRRMNVALTRGKHGVWVVGQASYLASSNRHWRALVRHARDRHCVVDTTAVADSGTTDNASRPMCPALAAVLRARVLSLRGATARSWQQVLDGRWVSGEASKPRRNRSRSRSRGQAHGHGATHGGDNKPGGAVQLKQRQQQQQQQHRQQPRARRRSHSKGSSASGQPQGRTSKPHRALLPPPPPPTTTAPTSSRRGEGKDSSLPPRSSQRSGALLPTPPGV